MAKMKNVFVCQECGYESPKWMGKCPGCSSWNSFVEEVKDELSSKKSDAAFKSVPKPIKTVKSGEYERIDTGISELNRVLGGGLVKGSLTLISGAPGIGKSTILLQCAYNISLKYGKVLYISGEESEEQIKMRADRLNAVSDNLYIVSETDIEVIEEHIRTMEPLFVIIDSIQTLYDRSMSSAPGSVSQVRQCSNDIMRIGKNKNIPFFIVAHVTKLGELAGPRVLEHMVDTVLFFEGERTEEFRILRTMKNRFGTTSEIGVFSMQETGLKEILNPSEVFLEETGYSKEGSVVVGIMEGSRPILVEVQALVSSTNAAIPRRASVGVDTSRLNLILAVLEKKFRIPFYKYDVYVNVVGGLNITGTSADLGIALALVSSIKDIPVKLEKLILVGEIGLTGEVRPVIYCDRIASEANKMGFINIVIPFRNKARIQVKGMNIISANNLKEAIDKVF